MKHPCLLALIAALSACNTSDDRASASRTARAEASDQLWMTPPAPTVIVLDADLALPRPLTCAAQIGITASARRVAICRKISPATHPPCSSANSCALIDDEIARGCALFDGKGSPMPECNPAPKSAAAAAAVVQRYYAALDAGDYATAWRQWGENGRHGQTLAKFTAGFAHTRRVRVAIGPLQPGDAGMGSIYQPVPVTVDAYRNDDTHQRFQGNYVVRRVNDVDGASAAQLRWHLDSAKLRSVAPGPIGG